MFSVALGETFGLKKKNDPDDVIMVNYGHEDFIFNRTGGEGFVVRGRRF